MKTEDLKEYLGIAADMEESIYLQKNLLSSIERDIDRLQVPAVFEDPIEPVKPHEPQRRPTPKSSYPPDLEWYRPEHSILQIIGGSIVRFFVSFVVLIIYTGVASVSEVPEVSAPLFFAALLLPMCCWIIYCIFGNKKAVNAYHAKFYDRKAAIEYIKKKDEADYQSRMEEYQKEMEEYQKEREIYQREIEENQTKRNRDEIERGVKTVFLQAQKAQVEKGLALSEQHLQAIYEKDVVFPKYRNLIMITSLYEYICAGRFTTLEGADGAYNCLETEIRLDHIVTQLDQVISHLEQIQANQFMLYKAVNNTNRLLGQILSSTREIVDSLGDLCRRLGNLCRSSVQLNFQISKLSEQTASLAGNLVEQNAQLNAHIAELQKTSALTAYQTERAQKELAYMNRMDYYSGRNDGVFWNHPPV